MSELSLFNSTTNKTVVDVILPARSFRQKLIGLMGRKNLPEGTGMFFEGGCPSVHTCFMNFPIDVVFLDKNMKVTAVVEDLKPWRMTKLFQFKNMYCLEVSSSKISNKISKGDLLYVRP